MTYSCAKRLLITNIRDDLNAFHHRVTRTDFRENINYRCYKHKISSRLTRKLGGVASYDCSKFNRVVRSVSRRCTSHNTFVPATKQQNKCYAVAPPSPTSAPLLKRRSFPRKCESRWKSNRIQHLHAISFEAVKRLCSV